MGHRSAGLSTSMALFPFSTQQAHHPFLVFEATLSRSPDFSLTMQGFDHPSFMKKCQKVPDTAQSQEKNCILTRTCPFSFQNLSITNCNHTFIIDHTEECKYNPSIFLLPLECTRYRLLAHYSRIVGITAIISTDQSFQFPSNGLGKNNAYSDAGCPFGLNHARSDKIQVEI